MEGEERAGGEDVGAIFLETKKEDWEFWKGNFVFDDTEGTGGK